MYIYLKQMKKMVEVSDEMFRDYYRDINAHIKRQQRRGECYCPRAKQYLCDMDCWNCRYYRTPSKRSLDYEIYDNEGNILSQIENVSDPTEAPLDEALIDKDMVDTIRELSLTFTEEEKAILHMICEGKSQQEMADKLGINRCKLIRHRDLLVRKLRAYLENE